MYKQLTKEDRLRIYEGVNRNESLSEIGRAIGKDRSTIAREIRRNREARARAAYGKRYHSYHHRSLTLREIVHAAHLQGVAVIAQYGADNVIYLLYGEVSPTAPTANCFFATFL